MSLQQQIKNLFVEPGEQARRLETYLQGHGEKATLILKRTGESISLRLDRKKIVYKFSVCIEHFESITSTKYYPKALGLISNESAWAPVLSIGELQLIERFLDSEISFFHYLTRRSTIEDLMDFEADEQDLLSMYLTNGFCVDKTALQGRRVFLANADAAIRKPRSPNANRQLVELHGIHVSDFWKQTSREIYKSSDLPHRFDVIQTILNQYPPALSRFEKLIRKWKRGKGAEDDVAFSKYEIGDQCYVVAIHTMKAIVSADVWHERARNIAGTVAQMTGVTDCAVFLYVRGTAAKTFDGVSFFRMGRRV